MPREEVLAVETEYWGLERVKANRKRFIAECEQHEANEAPVARPRPTATR